MKPHRIVLIRQGECFANTDESKFTTEPDYIIELMEQRVSQACETGRRRNHVFLCIPFFAYPIHF